MKKLLALALAAFASTALANIAASPHDLSGGNVSNVTKYGNGTLSSCQYCHAPHNVNTAVADAPLWNRNLPAAASFTLYTNVVDTTVALGIGSLTCLSCHDGSSDMGDTFADGGAVTTGGLTTQDMTGYARVGTNLTDDHPVGVNYTGSGDFQTVAYVTTTGGLKLYGVTGSETVECGSCHEPHGDGDSTAGNGIAFLRAGVNVICTECHTK